MTAFAASILAGAASVALLMLILWLLHFPLRNAAIVDAGWAGGLALLAVIYTAMSGNLTVRVLLIAGMVTVWGLRLAFHLLTDRVIGHPEEGRYVQLRRDWKTNIPWKFLLFFEVQAVLCVVLSVPFLISIHDPRTEVSPIELVAVVVWFVAIAGEAVADAQLRRFKSRPESKGKTCREGLWRYSRHPNYFFEWLVWMSYALFAIASPWGWLGLLSPALILLFLFRITGIPATEAQALRSRGDDYREYQRSTSAFVPWFPRNAA